MELKIKIFCDGCGGQLKVINVEGSTAYEHLVVYAERCERCRTIAYCVGVKEALEKQRLINASDG